MLEERVAIEEARSLLDDLAGAAEDRRQVALAAAGRIEDRPEAVRNRFGAGEFFYGCLEIAFVVRNHR